MPKILIIDDDALVRRTIARILRSRDYELVLAEDGRRGLDLFRSEDPDLVITDMIMPEMQGTEVIREILALDSDAKIIAMSGGGRVANIDFLNVAEQLGSFETINKPFDAAGLLDAVARCLAAAAATDNCRPVFVPEVVARVST
jgi:DNA-binding NtrC family response regulator